MNDILVVGAGFSGSILARKFAEEQNKKVLLIERRSHIAGNMYDKVNAHGILIQEYGPHFLNTDKYWIIEYLQQYADLFEHSTKLLSFIDGEYVRLPFNFKTLQQLIGAKNSESLLGKLRVEYKGIDRVSVYTLMQNKDPEISSYGRLLFEKAFIPYTLKMWGLAPKDIDDSVLNRVLMALNYDERYLNKDFQYLPKEGFTKLFENMLNHPNITIQLDTDALEHLDMSSEMIKYHGKACEYVIYTGPIDELFAYKYGVLPYRSMEFTYETVKGDCLLPSEVVSYPQSIGYTRKTEYKQFNNQFLPHTEYTTIATEYPMQYDKYAQKGNEPYYPIVAEENIKLYEQYKAESKHYTNLVLCGRLAEYKYFNMDMVIERAFEVYEEIKHSMISKTTKSKNKNWSFFHEFI